MRVSDKTRKTVVFIGETPKGDFIPHGTGFITLKFEGDVAFQQIITAKHVIKGISGDIVQLRLNDKSNRARVLDFDKGEWMFHPDDNIDLAVCPSRIPVDEFDIQHLDLNSEMIANADSIGDRVCVGDEVMMPGMFVPVIGEAQNIPIVRFGAIAALPREQIETEYGYHFAYLVETHSYDGLSGSPVYSSPSLVQFGEGRMVMSERLSAFVIGLLLGHHSTVNPRDTIEIRSKSSPQEEFDTYHTPVNTGIGVVLPIDYVVELIDSEALTDLRLKAMN